MKYEKLNKNALKCMYLATGGGTVLGLALVGLGFYFNQIRHFHIPVLIFIGIATVLLLNALISPYFRFFRYRYRIDEESIDIVEGYLFVKRNIVPIERLHKLQMARGPIDRICHVAKVNVTTAGGEVTIRFLDEDKAERIADSLRKRINELVAAEKRAAAGGGAA